MKKNIWAAVMLVVAIALAAFLYYQSPAVKPNPGNHTGNIPSSFDQSISDSVITVHFPAADFSLATNPQQVLAKAYIPPCGEGFNYCLYYVGTAYKGTNFESAGIRIQKRADLADQAKCLTAQPTNYTGLTPVMATSSSNYAASAFPNVGDAAAGHYASGALYRLAYQGSCYEIETRIGQTQFANYPPGAIKEFTVADQSALQSEMRGILAAVTIPSGESVSFP